MVETRFLTARSVITRRSAKRLTQAPCPVSSRTCPEREAMLGWAARPPPAQARNEVTFEYGDISFERARKPSHIDGREVWVVSDGVPKPWSTD
jgi:hypothetical protein